jgi:hypothetical protein
VIARLPFAKQILVVRDAEGFMLSYSDPDDIPEEFADEQVATYELKSVGTLRIERRVETKGERRG